MSIRILITDDHPVVRSGLRGMISSEVGFEVVGEADNGSVAVDMAIRLRPDVVLMDLSMPVMDGVAATDAIKKNLTETQVLVLTTYDSDADILPAIEAGATGYLLKDVTSDELFRAIRAAARGESVLAPAVAARLMGRVRGIIKDVLSQREVEVLNVVADGASNAEIARMLHISEKTVKAHMSHIFSKLEVNDRTAAVTAALDKGIIRRDR